MSAWSWPEDPEDITIRPTDFGGKSWLNSFLHEDQSLICSSVVRMLGFQKSLWIHSSKHNYESLWRFSWVSRFYRIDWHFQALGFQAQGRQWYAIPRGSKFNIWKPNAGCARHGFGIWIQINHRRFRCVAFFAGANPSAMQGSGERIWWIVVVGLQHLII